MLGALVRRRGRLFAALAAILVVLVGAAVVAFGRSADVVVYNGRSQYGDEAVFTAWEDKTSKSLELRAGSAPELFERLRSEGDGDPGRPARHDRPREPLAREGGRDAAGRLHPGARGARCRGSTATPTSSGGG